MVTIPRHLNPSNLFLLLSLLLWLGCGDGKSFGLPKSVEFLPTVNENSKDVKEPYQFDTPSRKFKLSPKLKETSGLTVVDDGHVATVQDEKGEVFILSLQTGKIVKQTSFGKNGDYEGIQKVGDKLYVLRADATIYELKDDEEKGYKTKKLDTKIGATKCNSEGLGSDGERLILVCKNSTSKHRNKVYTIDIESSKLSKKPLFELDPSEVYKGNSLRPSALSVHPITGNIIVLSSKIQALLSYDKTGKFVDSWDFSKAGLEQPEGLTFMPNGDMVISSEGKAGPPMLAYFTWRGINQG